MVLQQVSGEAAEYVAISRDPQSSKVPHKAGSSPEPCESASQHGSENRIGLGVGL